MARRRAADRRRREATLTRYLPPSRRRECRRDGRLVLLPEQDRALWNAVEIGEALSLLDPRAVAESAGPAQALELLGGLAERLPRNHHVPATRAEMLLRLGAREEALRELDRAVALAPTDTERDFLRGRRTVAAGTGNG